MAYWTGNQWTVQKVIACICDVFSVFDTFSGYIQFFFQVFNIYYSQFMLQRGDAKMSNG